MEQPDIREFLGEEDETGLSGLGLALFGAFYFVLGLGSGWLIWG